MVLGTSVVTTIVPATATEYDLPMNDPHWAPQYQPQSANGSGATNVGRDQNRNTYNTYNAMSPDGVSMSYPAFKRAIDMELGAAQHKFGQDAQALEEHYRNLLAEAFSDYKEVQSDRDRLRAENSFLSGRGVALRASWKFPTGIAAISLLVGGYLSSLWSSPNSTDVNSSPAMTSGAGAASSNPVGVPIPPCLFRKGGRRRTSRDPARRGEEWFNWNRLTRSMACVISVQAYCAKNCRTDSGTLA